MHMCTHIYMYICMYLYMPIDVCIRISTYVKYWCVTNIQRLEQVQSWNGDLKTPSQPKWQKTWEKPRGCEGIFEHVTSKIHQLFILLILFFFFKERKWQKKNSRDLAKFQNLLERRQLVGHEKSVEITGSLFSKCSCFVFLVMWQEKNFLYPCVRYLAQPSPPAAQSHWWQKAGAQSILPVLFLTDFLLEQLL